MSDEFSDEDSDSDDALDHEPASGSPDTTYKLVIDGLPHEAIMEAVYRTIAQRVEAKLTKEHEARIKSTIEKCVNDAVTRIIDNRLELEVNRLIDQGWDEHDTWGQRTGKKFTLAERITTYLQQQVDVNGNSDNRWSSGDKRQRIVWYVDKAVNAVFDKETTTHVEAFKKQVKEKFTKTFSDQVTATLKEALGLR